MIFLVFESYDESRSGLRRKPPLVVQQVETAQFLPKDMTPQLTGELANVSLSGRPFRAEKLK